MSGFFIGEGVRPVADFPLSVCVEHLYDVKTYPHSGAFPLFVPRRAFFLLLQHGVPLVRRQYDTALFFPVDGVCWRPVRLAGARFDLHKNQLSHAADAAHQVHFTSDCGPEVLIKDFVTCPAQKTCGSAFALPAKPGRIRLRWRFSREAAPPRQSPQPGVRAGAPGGAPAQN